MEQQLTFLNPDKYAIQRTLAQTYNEMDIAAEIFIARHRAIHYVDLMDSVDKTKATKNMLLSWLNDCIRKGNFIRSGIISMYKSTFPNHFDNGKWQARYIGIFINYAINRLTDEDFIKDKKKVRLFVNSIMDKDWYWKAVAVMGIKLLEDLHANNALKSVAARSLIDQIIIYRDMLEKIGRITGRIGKTGNIDEQTRQELIDIHREGARKGLESAIHAIERYEEHRLYERYQRDIEAGLMEALKANTNRLLGPSLEATGTDFS